jgi:exodeoxyribonuclease V alpha subunit
MSETLEGTVSRVVYAAPDGGFAVVRLEVAGREEPVTAVGPIGHLAEGEAVRVEGEWERHRAHGDQLRAARAVAILPQSEAGVRRYLEGLRGIGPKLAGKLVEAFGAEALAVVSDQPWRAAKVKGVGGRRAAQAAGDARARKEEREVMVFLQGLGISAAFAARIRRAWGDGAVARLQRNPYLLAREVAGIGFQTADQIARRLGIDERSPLRIEAGIYQALEGFSDEGSCYAPRPALLERAQAQLAAEPGDLEGALAQLVGQGAVRLEDDGVWLPRLQTAEVELAKRIDELERAPRRPLPPPKGSRTAKAVEALSDGPRRAFDRARAGGVCVITGGPGTGKTTLVKALVAAWQEARRRVVLAAPTGRAAKRLGEATGAAARTVHRLLEWGRGTDGRGGFGRDGAHPLEADLVVVDEASMLDLPLARALAQAVPRGATLVLVGDVDQLPSVGPGQVLADLIASRAVEVARLDRIFRQGEGSRIIANAHRVLEGQLPEPAPPSADGAARDFFVVRAEQPEQARDLVVRLVRDRIPRAFSLHPARDVQVLTPMHRGEAGTEALNRALQDALNPGGDAYGRGTRPALRVGDKVMQARNDYDRDVFNGDVGEVVAVDEAGRAVEVRFDDKRTRYEGDAVDQLELAYAVSIHKSQGSEYPAVVCVLLPQHYLLLQRNLLYTAITRGKRLVVLVGAERAIRRAVENDRAERRWTKLGERLRALREA